MISGQTKLAGLFADPASHSLSPLMHNTAFEANNIDAVVFSFQSKPNEFEASSRKYTNF